MSKGVTVGTKHEAPFFSPHLRRIRVTAFAQTPSAVRHMSASPFAVNKKDLFSGKAKPKPESYPPEPVTLIADKCQVITAMIPFGTRRSAEIRQHMHSNIKMDGNRIFIFRSVNGWTNISLDSTESTPKLTCDPIHTLKQAWREFNDCPAVSDVSIKWKGSDVVLGYDDIDMMEAQFVPLPAGDPSSDDGSATGTTKTDAEVLYDMMKSMDDMMTKQQAAIAEFDTKLVHIISVTEGLAKQLGPIVESSLIDGSPLVLASSRLVQLSTPSRAATTQSAPSCSTDRSEPRVNSARKNTSDEADEPVTVSSKRARKARVVHG